MSDQFEPLRSQPGEFRVALCLTQLGDRAFEVLKLSESLGFDAPRFISDSAGDVWAIVLQQFHAYEADPLIVVDPWDDQLSQLWQACEPDAELAIVISHNFEAYHLDAA
ncbi:hypothetical protein LEP3755_64970 (plasmid) [Leptolyngbya sp. NIES-3755]|nr:hypothetical protein LEP3755_64970 [Leptolyngbya sp. NIES-3755]